MESPSGRKLVQIRFLFLGIVSACKTQCTQNSPQPCGQAPPPPLPLYSFEHLILQGGAEPGEIGGISGTDRNGDNLGHLVGMQLSDPGSNGLEFFTCGLDKEQAFLLVTFLPFPDINRANSGNDVDARGLARLYKSGRNFFSEFKSIGCAQDQDFIHVLRLG
jgi:hypothetical protein